MALVPSGSRDHRVNRIAPDDYEISWVVYSRASGTRLLTKTRQRRYTDEKGAKRFAKKWKIAMPDAA